MANSEHNKQQTEQKEIPQEESFGASVDFQQLIGQVISKWYWIIISIAIAAAIAWLYVKKTPPVYQVQSSLLIKDESNDLTKNQGTLNQRSQFTSVFSVANNFSTEMDIVGSRTLIKKVVEDLDLYISQVRTDTYQPRDLWSESPIKVWMAPSEAERTKGTSFRVKLNTNGSLEVVTKNSKTGKEKTTKYPRLPINVRPESGGVVSISRVDSVPIESSMEINVNIYSPTTAAGSYKRRLSISQTNKESFITSLTMNDSRPERAMLFIKRLVEAYNADANDDKNQIARRTDEFINNRIALISSELGQTEDKLAKFKQEAGITDLTSDAQQALQGRSKYNAQIAENETQRNLIGALRDEVKANLRKNEVLPTVVGIEQDQKLSQLINEYNKQVIERNRLSQNATSKNPVIANLDNELQRMRENILTTLNQLYDGTAITDDKLQEEVAGFQSTIRKTPEGEKQFLSISRERDFQSQLYLLLLQKREENAIKLAATANNGRIIEDPEVTQQVAPRRMIILLVAIIIGMAIPIGIIYLSLLLAVKISGVEDVTRASKLPIIGNIPMHKGKKGERRIVVHENSNGMMDEAFRNLRTNIQFMLHDASQKVIMITSAVAGEGKSTIAGNLAASYAFLGKKVVIVGLDIRKPGLNKVFKLSTRAYGISQYLAHPDEEDLLALVQQSEESPNLYILPGGIVPPNPTELLSQKSLDQAIDLLKENFDLVILDTAPVGLVSDSQVISRVADVTIATLRMKYSYKSAAYFFDNLANDKMLPNVGFVLNAVTRSSTRSYGHYGYGYGKRYGYGYGQYGYGYELAGSKKKKGLFGKIKSLF